MGVLSLTNSLIILFLTVLVGYCAFVVYCGVRVLISSRERYLWTSRDTTMLLSHILLGIVSVYGVSLLITGDV